MSIVPNSPHTNKPLDEKHRAVLAAACYYAQQGLYVFPVHNPIFDEHGSVTGCTCEAWRRENVDPGYVCKQPGKCPRVRWRDRSTTSWEQVGRWWGHAWQDGHVPNIGIDMGKSGLLGLDLDAYKDAYSGPGVELDEETVTVLSGGGGNHLWYRMEPDDTFGNSTGSLPAGIDIRGHGGYMVVPPSIHHSGREYQFEGDYSPRDIQPAPIPAQLRELLQNAQKRSAAVAVTLPDITTDKPNIDGWRLSESVRERIHNPAQRGERSEHDYGVVSALVRAGAGDDDILAVFQHYPIGTAGKFAERGNDYLARTIGAVRARVRAFDAELANVRAWLLSADLGQHVPADLHSRSGYRTQETDRRVADALLDVAQERRSWRLTVGFEELRRRAGVGTRATVGAALARLGGWFAEVEPGDGQTANTYHLTPIVEFVVATLNSISISPPCDLTVQCSNNKLYSQHKHDDPWLRGRSKAAKMLGNVLPGLGSTPLQVIDYLGRHGPSTRQEIAEGCGLKKWTVANATRRLEDLYLLDVEQENRRTAKLYSLSADLWPQVERLRSKFKTFLLGAQREDAALESTQRHVEREQGYRKITADFDALGRLRRRHNNITERRIALQAELHPDWSTEQAIRWVMEPARLKREWVQRKNDEIDRLNLDDVMLAVQDAQSQGIDWQTAKHDLEWAGYSPREIAHAGGMWGAK